MRTCIKEPIPELYDAYGALQNAIDAHLAGGTSEAAEHFKLANCPVVWTWLNTAWVGVTKHVVTLRPSGDTRTIIRADRYPDRNIAKNVRQMVLARDGYRCRYCGLPVVHADIRKIAHSIYPEAVPWNSRVASQQHSGFQAFWLQFDHVEPHSHGGQSSVENVVVTCALCNFGKDRHTLLQLELEDPRLRLPIPSEYDGLERFRSAAPRPTKVVDEAQAVAPRRGGTIQKSEGSSSFFFPGAKISGGYVSTPVIAGSTRWFKLSPDVECEQVVRAGIAGYIVRCSPKLLARRGIDPDFYADRTSAYSPA
ncbi:MAG: HNH endonuclease [Polymorphobacter sp.]